MPNQPRIERLAEALREAGADAFLAWSPVTMGYLHGFHEGAHERFLALAISARGEVRMICPALSEAQARRSGIEDVRGWRDGEDPVPLFQGLAGDWALRSGILAVDDELPAHLLLQMQAALPAALFKPGGSILSSLMRRKEPEELDHLRTAGRIADETFEDVLGFLRPGLTETEVARFLAAKMEERGAGPGFAIVATGAGSAEPHHLSDDTPLKEGDVVVLDFGCDIGGYKSDITRTVCLGRASERAREVYDVVYRAHMAGREAVRAGATCGAVDAAARAVIEAAGYGPQFVHRTGHGIGLRGHEEPYVVGGSEVTLEAGDCFSVEPGVYLTGELGVRVENIVAATESGHESLNAEPSPTLIEIA